MSNWFAWHHSPVQYVVNPASSLFNGELNEVGRTFPVVNGVRTWTTTAEAATDQMANAINGPVIERRGTSVRLIEPRRNLASAVIDTPANGPWNACVDVQAIRAFAAGSTQSSEALRSIAAALPLSGIVRVHVLANPQFSIETLAHERRHAEDIRQCFNGAFTAWEEAISLLAGSWFPNEQALDQALFSSAGLTENRGPRLRRLAEKICLNIGLLAVDLHEVRDRNRQFMLVNPRWIAAERTLEFSFQEAGPISVSCNRGPRRSSVLV